MSRLDLAPSEYSGEANACVCGRVVLMRGPVNLSTARGGKGKTKGSNQTKDAVDKLEVHLLGGQTPADILFMDCWSDLASQVKTKLELHSVYRISGVKVIHQTPRNSTSRLPYFIRVQSPLGLKTKLRSARRVHG